MEYYAAITKNENLPLAAIWMDLEIIMLNEECLLILLKLRAIKKQQKKLGTLLIILTKSVGYQVDQRV